MSKSSIMQGRRLPTVFMAGISLLASATMAQPAYKCGDSSYSQLPCPGAVVIGADPRTSAQKAQADQATVRDAKSAADMEKSRLAQEKLDLAANRPAAAASKPRANPTKKKKKKEPENRVVHTPAKKTAPTTNSEKKDAVKP